MTVSVVGPVSNEALTVMWKVCPTSPAPDALSCVGGTSIEVMNLPVVQPAQVINWPSTKGRAFAAMPPVIVICAPAIVPLLTAA